MAGTVQSNHDDAFAEINTTPLIDVMLVLLTLLIITLPMQTHAIKIDMPHPSPGHPVADLPPVELAVAWDGAVTWDGTPVGRATLDAYLAQDAKRSLPRGVAIRADTLAKYDSVARVLADASHAGEKNIRFDWNL